MICPHCNNEHDKPLDCPKGSTIKVSAELVMEQAALIEQMKIRIGRLLLQHPADCVCVEGQTVSEVPALRLYALNHLTWHNRVRQILLES